MLSSIIKSGLVKTHQKLQIKKHGQSILVEVEIDYLIIIENNVIGYGFNYREDTEPTNWYGIPEWFKLSKDISHKVSILSREYTDAFCFIKQPSRILYLPNSVNTDIIQLEYIESVSEFKSKIESRNNQICKEIEYQRELNRKQEMLNNQTHFNKFQLESISAILNRVDELLVENYKVFLDLYVYSRINFTIIVTPSSGNPLGDEQRYYFNKKEDEWGSEFEEIPYSTGRDLGNKFISHYISHKNTKQKKLVSREQFEKFMNESISYQELKDIG